MHTCIHAFIQQIDWMPTMSPYYWISARDGRECSVKWKEGQKTSEPVQCLPTWLRSQAQVLITIFKICPDSPVLSYPTGILGLAGSRESCYVKLEGATSFHSFNFSDLIDVFMHSLIRHTFIDYHLHVRASSKHWVISGRWCFSSHEPYSL